MLSPGKVHFTPIKLPLIDSVPRFALEAAAAIVFANVPRFEAIVQKPDLIVKLGAFSTPSLPSRLSSMYLRLSR